MLIGIIRTCPTLVLYHPIVNQKTFTKTLGWVDSRMIDNQFYEEFTNPLNVMSNMSSNAFKTLTTFSRTIQSLRSRKAVEQTPQANGAYIIDVSNVNLGILGISTQNNTSFQIIHIGCFIIVADIF